MSSQRRTNLSRRLRSATTDGEAQLWFHLRNRQLEGFKFRRQHAIGPYVADFFCYDTRLVIEVDGSQHMENEAYDAERSRYLEGLGLRIVRFTNAEVMGRTSLILEEILRHLRNAPSP
jgi:adenine-specific DNA-methyltransferase